MRWSPKPVYGGSIPPWHANFILGVRQMKQKRQLYRNRHLAIKGNPLFGMRVCKAKKGKGSYDRKSDQKIKEVF
jgi:stalled ribosome alternative rescue factor ArfA